MSRSGNQQLPADLASNPHVSAWVSASAGTGKTHVLIQRLKKLLLSGVAADRILCITFTNAAAAEMANRLHDDLSAWTLISDERLFVELSDLLARDPDKEEIDRARRLFAIVLETPGGLKIQTIHSFCQSLLGRFPLEAGLSPRFESLDERSARTYLNEAVSKTLQKAAAQENETLWAAISHISQHISEFNFPDLVKGIIGQRTKFETFFRGQPDDSSWRPLLLRALGLAPDTDKQTLLAAACNPGDHIEAALHKACEMLARGTKTDRRRAETVKKWLMAGSNRGAVFDDYLAGFFNKDGNPSKVEPGKAVNTAHPECAGILRDEQARLQTIRDNLKLLFVAESTVALLYFAHALLLAYETHKDQQGVLDYDDLIFKTRQLLRETVDAAWVLFKLDGGIDHVLIDEAQDTSPDQWQIIDALADEFFAGEGARELTRTVFAVGDIKQSIYSFQGAQPEEFERYKSKFRRQCDMARLGFTEQRMIKSYRSSPPVLKLVDAVFDNPLALAGLVFEDEVIEHDTDRTGHAGLVELWPVIARRPAAEDDNAWRPQMENRSDPDPVSELANEIARRIQNWLSSEERLESFDRPMRAGDILILLQKRKPLLDPLVRALKACNLPVAGADRLSLTEQLAVKDLLAIAHFALLPEDDLTLAGVLKSPFLGLDDDDLMLLAHGRDTSIWISLQNAAKNDIRYREARDFLQEVLDCADYLPPFEFFSRILSARRGRRAIVSRLGHEANDPIDELLNLALEFEELHPPSLQGFLQWIETVDDEIKRDQEQRRDEIRIMTVHGAKGLQAPVVILPDTCRGPSQERGILWFGENDEVPFWPVRTGNEVGIVETARNYQEQQRTEEYHRLLYVALTRAQDRLYVSGWELGRHQTQACWYDFIADAMKKIHDPDDIVSWDGPEALAQPVILRHSSPQTKPPADKEQPAVAISPRELPEWANRMPPSESRPERPLVPSRPAGEEPPALSPLDIKDQAHFIRGRLIHMLLEHLPDITLQEREHAGRRLIARHAGNLPEPDHDAILTEVLDVLNDPALRDYFADGGMAEVPVTGIVDDFAVSGQIDRLIITPDEVRIVDYKTNRLPPARPEDVPTAYLHQVAVYAALLQEIYPQRAIKCALLWTDGPHLMEIPSKLLNEFRAGLDGTHAP